MEEVPAVDRWGAETSLMSTKALARQGERCCPASPLPGTEKEPQALGAQSQDHA